MRKIETRRRLNIKAKNPPQWGGFRYSKFDSGDHVGSPLRNPRHSAEGFSSRHSRAPGQASRLRATTRGRPYGGRFEMWITPGDHAGSPLRNPRQLAEVFSSRHSRALDETSRFGIRGIR